MVRIRLRILSAVALPLALLACGKRDDDRNLDSLDNELVEAGSGNANVSDPAMTAALHDQIMVDPALTQHANADSVRPPAQPYSGGVPPTGIAQPPGRTPGSAGASTAARESLTLGALAARQTNRRTSACAGALRYSASWADRLPADVPLYPGARVTEAAGANTGACALRAVSFSTNARLQTVVDWYYTRVTNTGFTAEHQSDGTQHTLGGTRDRDGGAYVLFLTPRRDGGTDVDLIANNGN
jgi:hypothetical protein